MKAILVRIGVDHSYGAWNAPVDPTTGQFVYVPIPDAVEKQYSRGNARRYEETVASLSEFAGRCGAPDLQCPDTLQRRKMHLDPDFEHLTYGDNGARRGAGIALLRPDDLLVFYAGLRSTTGRRELIYALIGLFVVKEVIRAVDLPVERRHENAHTRWQTISENDVIVRAKRGLSGRFSRCIPMGEWRDRAYRVRPDIEQAWGGLSVKNGYVQRSAVPPEFRDPPKFYNWFQKQGIALIGRNN